MIGDGKNANVWLDHWLPVNPPRRVVQVSYNQNMRVGDLILIKKLPLGMFRN